MILKCVLLSLHWWQIWKLSLCKSDFQKQHCFVLLMSDEPVQRQSLPQSLLTCRTGAAQPGTQCPRAQGAVSTTKYYGTSLKSPLPLTENQRYSPKFPALAVWRLLKRTQRLNIHWRILREPRAMGLSSLILSAIHSFLPDTAAIRIFQTNSEEFFSYLAYKNSTIHLTRSGFLS